MSLSDLPAPPVARPAGLRAVFELLRDTTFRSLRHRNYRLYFFGQIVSFTGSWMQNAALMWLIYDRTGDPIWPPLMLVAQVGPTIFFGPWGGALADRTPKRPLIFRTQLGFLTTTLVLLLVTATGHTDPWLLFGVQVLNGMIQSVDLPARLAFVPDLVPRTDLINAVSLNSLLFNSARAIGPAITGSLFLLADAVIESGWLPGVRAVTFGAVCCFAVNAVSYLAVLVALQRIKAPGEPGALATGGSPPVANAPGSPKPAGSSLDGLRYVAARPMLAILLAFTGFVCVFGWPALSLFPAYTKLVLGLAEKEYSVLVSGLGAGALVAALTTATFGTVARRGFLLSSGAAVMAFGLAGLIAANTLSGAVAAAAGLGFGLILFLSTGQSAVQLSASDEARGRVMALWAMTLSASAPVGHLLAGAAAQWYGVVPVLWVMMCGAGAAAAGIVGVSVSRGWKLASATAGR